MAPIELTAIITPKPGKAARVSLHCSLLLVHGKVE